MVLLFALTVALSATSLSAWASPLSGFQGDRAIVVDTTVRRPSDPIRLFSAPDTQYRAGSADVVMAGGELRISVSGDPERSAGRLVSAFHNPTETLYLLDPDGWALLRITGNGRVEQVAEFPGPGGAGILETFDQGVRMGVGERGQYLYFWPEAVGDVARYDLQANLMAVVSNTLLTSFSEGHSATLLRENEIHVFGGYGRWTRWNVLLQYVPFTRGWDRVNLTNEAPEGFLPFSSALVYDPPNNRFIVTVALDSTSHGQDDEWLLVYEADLDSKQWNRLSTHQIPPRRVGMDRVAWDFNSLRGALGGGQIDTASGLVAYAPPLFYDSRNHRFELLDTTLFVGSGTWQPGGAATGDGADADAGMASTTGRASETEARTIVDIHHANRSGRWIFVSREAADSTTRVIVHTLDMSRRAPYGRRLSDVELALRSFDLNSLKRATGWGLAALIGLIYALIGRRARPSDSMADDPRIGASPETDAPSSPLGGSTTEETDERMWVALEPNGRMRINRKGEEILTPDENFVRLVRLLVQMKRNGWTEMPLSDVDEFLVPHQSHQPNTRLRKKLLNTFNSIIGRQVLSIRKSGDDKRFRLLGFDLSCIVVDGDGVDHEEPGRSVFANGAAP